MVYVDQWLLAQFGDFLRVIGHERVRQFVLAEIQQYPVHHVGQFLVGDGSAGRARHLTKNSRRRHVQEVAGKKSFIFGTLALGAGPVRQGGTLAVRISLSRVSFKQLA